MGPLDGADTYAGTLPDRPGRHPVSVFKATHHSITWKFRALEEDRFA